MLLIASLWPILVCELKKFPVQHSSTGTLHRRTHCVACDRLSIQREASEARSCVWWFDSGRVPAIWFGCFKPVVHQPQVWTLQLAKSHLVCYLSADICILPRRAEGRRQDYQSEEAPCLLETFTHEPANLRYFFSKMCTVMWPMLGGEPHKMITQPGSAI